LNQSAQENVVEPALTLIISQVVWPHQFGYGVEHENASVNAAAAPEGLSPLS